MIRYDHDTVVFSVVFVYYFSQGQLMIRFIFSSICQCTAVKVLDPAVLCCTPAALRRPHVPVNPVPLCRRLLEEDLGPDLDVLWFWLQCYFLHRGTTAHRSTHNSQVHKHGAYKVQRVTENYKDYFLFLFFLTNPCALLGPFAFGSPLFSQNLP